jgi:hypothetical protein
VLFRVFQRTGDVLLHTLLHMYVLICCGCFCRLPSSLSAASVDMTHMVCHICPLSSLVVFCMQVCVVVVCAVQRDITHAGYLALALIGFRHRQPQPAASGPVQNSAAPAGVGRGPDQASANLLAWLQTFNVCVMAAMLLYQVSGSHTRRSRCRVCAVQVTAVASKLPVLLSGLFVYQVLDADTHPYASSVLCLMLHLSAGSVYMPAAAALRIQPMQSHPWYFDH